jgi:DNA-binding MarR family transcriptional regulator
MPFTSIPEETNLTIDRFWETIPPTWNQIRNNLRSIATENFGISVEQFHILRNIRRGVKSVSDLAEVKQISRPAISQAVEMLVEKGYISRQSNPQDRRYIELTLTADGSALLDTIFDKNRLWMAEKLANLSPAELQIIQTGMDLFSRAITAPVA